MKDYIVERKTIPSTGRDIKLLILHPLKNASPGATTLGILLIHGGGYRTGMAGMIFMSRVLNLVKK